MKVLDLVRAMDAIAPARWAAPWDNVGLLVGDPAAKLSRVLLAVDCTPAVVDEAAREGCEAIVAYHPVVFRPQKTFVAGSPAYALARAGIAVVSPHTALDAAPGGTNDVLADALRMTDRAPLTPVDPANPAAGFGRVGAIPEATVAAIASSLKEALGVAHVLVAGSLDGRVSRAAVCAGSGGELLPAAVAAAATLFVTGELRHHDALAAVAAGVAVIALRHSASERCALPAIARRLASALPEVAVARSDADVEPFAFA